MSCRLLFTGEGGGPFTFSLITLALDPCSLASESVADTGHRTQPSPIPGMVMVMDGGLGFSEGEKTKQNKTINAVVGAESLADGNVT